MVECELPFTGQIDPMFRCMRNERQSDGKSGDPATRAFSHNLCGAQISLSGFAGGRKKECILFVTPFANSHLLNSSYPAIPPIGPFEHPSKYLKHSDRP